MTTITVPLVPPSPNVLRRQYRHPHAYRKLRQAWEHSLRYACGSASTHLMLMRQGTSRVRLKITVYHAKLYDDDNLPASLKPVIDALRNIGYIHDDNREWLDLVPPAQISGRNTMERKTVVELEAAGAQ